MKLENKAFYIPILVFLFILFSKIIFIYRNFANFPYYPLGDSANYLLQTYFLAKYGFHSFVPDIYNGIILFNNYQPGWPFFVLPFYKFIGNVALANYFGLIFAYILGFVAVYSFGKIQKYSSVKIIAFYAILFGNPFSIKVVLDLFRFGEFLGWILFLFFITVILYYKNHRLDKKFVFLFVLFYSLIILTHPYVAVLSSFVILPFFFVKILREKIVIVISNLFPLLITSFWWVPFLSTFDKPISGLEQLKELLLASSFLSYNTIFLISFLILIYFYLSDKKTSWIDKKFWLFFLVLGILIISRIILFVPLLNKVPPNAYNMFYLILNLYLLFEINFTRRIRNVAIFLLAIFPIISLIIVLPYEDTSNYNVGKDVIKIISPINEDSLIYFDRSSSYVVYTLVEKNLPLTFGVDLIHFEAKPDVLIDWYEIRESIFKRECTNIKDNLVKYKVKYVVSAFDYCEFFEVCGLENIKEEGNACLLSVSLQ